MVHVQLQHLVTISIHALREEGDITVAQSVVTACDISIHALREEGDWTSSAGNRCWKLFLSTPSVRRATSAYRTAAYNLSKFLSTPSVRRATGGGSPCTDSCSNFYPRPP